jgi:dTDP-4-amino-4,6-dideoxygalactose transaminase
MATSLALYGGTPVLPPDIVRAWPHVTDEDRRAIAEVVAGESLGPQRNHQAGRLAHEFAEYIGVKHCIPTNSGTAALHMGIAALGVDPGDEVIVPAFTFWASAAAVLHHNAIPVFVDIAPDTWCIDPARIEEKITPRTRAIMPVHIHGLSADMDPIRAIAARHDLKLIEDCAQAHGARYHGEMCGTMGDVAGFSTQMSKVLTSGSEGGLFVTDNDEHAEAASLLQYFGEHVVTGMERQTQAYNASGVGWMYRGDVFGQAFVRSQLRRLDAMNQARAENCLFLNDRLRAVPGVTTPVIPDGCEHVFYNYVLGLAPEALDVDMAPAAFRDAVQAALTAEGVGVGQWQRVPVPAQEVFRNRHAYGRGCPWSCWKSEVRYDAAEYPVALDFLARHTYVFDIHPPNDLDTMELYAQAIEKVIDQASALQPVDPELNDRYLAARNPWESTATLAGSD